MSYAKIYTDILTSSICEENVTVRWLWVVLLVRCNKYGQVSSTIPGLARLANLTVEQTESAMARLTGPDWSSTSPDEDGRRVLPLGQNLWQIVNYLKYRNMRDPDAEREATRVRVQRHRDKKRAEACNADVTVGNDDETASNPIVAVAASEDGDGDTPCGVTQATTKTPRQKFSPPTVSEVAEYVTAKGYTFDPETFVAHYEARGWQFKNGSPMRNWKATCTTWSKNQFSSGVHGRRNGSPPRKNSTNLSGYDDKIEEA